MVKPFQQLIKTEQTKPTAILIVNVCLFFFANKQINGKFCTRELIASNCKNRTNKQTNKQTKTIPLSLLCYFYQRVQRMANWESKTMKTSFSRESKTMTTSFSRIKRNFRQQQVDSRWSITSNKCKNGTNKTNKQTNKQTAIPIVNLCVLFCQLLQIMANSTGDPLQIV